MAPLYVFHALYEDARPPHEILNEWMYTIIVFVIIRQPFSECLFISNIKALTQGLPDEILTKIEIFRNFD